MKPPKTQPTQAHLEAIDTLLRANQHTQARYVLTDLGWFSSEARTFLEDRDHEQNPVERTFSDRT